MLLGDRIVFLDVVMLVIFGNMYWREWERSIEGETWELLSNNNKYEPLYISSHSRVANAKGKIMKPKLIDEYLSISAKLLVPSGKRPCKDDRGTIRIHRLVAWVKYGYNDETKVVNHIDGNKLNNHKDNLEYITSRENTIHAIQTGSRIKFNTDELAMYDHCHNLVAIYSSRTEAIEKSGYSESVIRNSYEGKHTDFGKYSYAHYFRKTGNTIKS